MNSQPQKKIIHIDMDCFYAAVEMREHPHLQGKAVAVGGLPKQRGVVAACNYEARKFGIHSAMAMSRALQLCPDLQVRPVNIDCYKQISARIHEIFIEYTSIIEPVSLDEAYLDVTLATRCNGSATLIAREIRNRIFESENLTASAGVAPNKFLAKVASDWNKPDGQKVITPDQISDFVKDLPVKRISGVGKVTARKMQSLNIQTCGDLQALDHTLLNQHFGRFGARLYEYSRGIDTRSVAPNRIRKSLSVEDTFAEDLPNLESCLLELSAIYKEFQRRLQRFLLTDNVKYKLTVKNLFVKLRFNDFETTTVQTKATQPDKQIFMRLCADAWQRSQRPVRLIGIGVQFNPPDFQSQLGLFDNLS